MRYTFPFILLMALCTSHGIWAQKVDIDREKFSFPRTVLPAEPLDKDVYFYEVKVDSDPSIEDYLSDEEIASGLLIEGMKQAYNQEKHFNVHLYTSTFIMGTPSIKSRVSETKDKDGRVSRHTYYSFTIKYTWDAYYESTKPDGSVLTEKEYIFSKDNPQEYSSKEYNSSAEVKQYLKVNLKALKSTLVKECVAYLNKKASSHLSYLVGYRQRTVNENLWNMDSKKHPENAAFQKNVALLLSAISELDFTSKPEGLEAKVAPAVDYFTQLSKGDTEDKQNRRLVFASAFNLGMFYNVMEQPIEAKKWGQFLIDSDVDKKDGQSIIDRAEKIELNLLANEVSTSRFARTIPKPTESQEIADTEETEETKEPEVAKFVQCLAVTDKDEEIEGYLINDFYNKPWEVQDGVLFVPNALFNDGDFSKKSIEKYSPKELKALSFNKMTFISVLYSDVSKLTDGNPLSATAKRRFVQVVQNGKYKLLRFYEEPSSMTVFSGSIPDDEIDPADMDFYPLMLKPDSDKAVLITTKMLEDLLAKNKPLFSRYQKGEFSVDGKPIDTKRGLLERLEAKTDLDENINLELLITELNK
ncbi:hypothetical protein LAG90_09775 [Marinilongibacter aquaticus]|uniref:hypothetical protein n=1 Tax=Marinilongibacter aquaticus TaxID=2975157 RepID=UPI0021BD03D3|nr:hypothetical protein [Marinilongibacter aquaticus]UBM60921.1 hypothetical protein LAG90_09775 [Marinilongibacter aquaticus]